jgi:predicted nucleotide-binding protein
LITAWFDGQILPSAEWDKEIRCEVEEADIVVFLVSTPFLRSKYIRGAEIATALKRRALGQAEVVAVILEPDCDWKEREFTRYQVLPPGVKAVRSWPRHADAFNKVEQELRRLIKEMLAKRDADATTRKQQPMPKDSKAHVFVSHSSKDKPFARKLVEALRRHNLNVWIDERELQVGDSIVTGVSEGLKDVGYLVAVLSKASMASRWVQAELNAALMEELSGKGVAVLPVLIEDCEVPPLLKDRVYADFRGDFQAGLQKLLAVFEQEGESTADVTPNAATAAAPCSKKLSAITLADLRRRISKRMDRGEVAGLWFAVLETAMENDMAGRQLSECVISLLDKAKSRNRLPIIIEEICQDRPDLADP